jgi:hypothetical protein
MNIAINTINKVVDYLLTNLIRNPVEKLAIEIFLSLKQTEQNLKLSSKIIMKQMNSVDL